MSVYPPPSILAEMALEIKRFFRFSGIDAVGFTRGLRFVYRLFLKAFPSVYVGKPEDCRCFLSALLWITKHGATWRAIPKVYGHWNSIYHRFGRRCDAGVFQALHEHFHDAGEISAILVDSTIVRAHCSAAGALKETKDNRSKTLVVAEVDLPRS